MVICEKHNFIFLRIPKNASTSLATFFIKGYTDKHDIYTGVGDAGIKSKNVPEKVLNKYREGYRFIHLTLQELVDNNLVSEEKLQDKRCIGVIREPLDRQLSLYFFKRRSRPGSASPAEFREMFSRGFCAGDTNNQFLQTDYLTVNGQNYGEYWLYDDLTSRLNMFIKETPPDRLIDLPTYKSKMRKTLDKEELIEQYYDQKTLDAVKKYYEKDFELYGQLKNGKNL